MGVIEEALKEAEATGRTTPVEMADLRPVTAADLQVRTYGLL